MARCKLCGKDRSLVLGICESCDFDEPDDRAELVLRLRIADAVVRKERAREGPADNRAFVKGCDDQDKWARRLIDYLGLEPEW